MEVVSQSLGQLRYGLITLQVNVFVFDGPPQSLDEYVVQRTTPAVHADGNRVPFQNARKLRRSELTSLIRVENFRFADGQGVLQCVDAEVAFQGV